MHSDSRVVRDAWAQALSFGGERILSTSEVRCAGSVVMVNGKRFAAPFIIYAIGDPTTLYNALTMRGGVVDVLSQWKINVTVQMSEKLLIEKYTGTIPTDYLSTPTATGEEGSEG